MYQRILVCTDGSTLAQRAAFEGVQLASKLKAKVVALLVTPPFVPPKGYETSPLAVQIERHERDSKAAAKRWLGAIAEQALAARVRLRDIARRTISPGSDDCGDRGQAALRSHRHGFAWPRCIGPDDAGFGRDACRVDVFRAAADRTVATRQAGLCAALEAAGKMTPSS